MEKNNCVVIYDDTDLAEYMDAARENLLANGVEEDEISDSLLSEEMCALTQEDWEEAERELGEFFSKDRNPYGFLLVGTIGRWNGTFRGGFDFRDMDGFYARRPLEDCDSVKFYDVDGHFHVEGVHHDGRVAYEVRELTERGRATLDRWEENSWREDRSLEEVHAAVFNDSHYSKLPRFAAKVYGC